MPLFGIKTNEMLGADSEETPKEKQTLGTKFVDFGLRSRKQQFELISALNAQGLWEDAWGLKGSQVKIVKLIYKSDKPQYGIVTNIGADGKLTVKIGEGKDAAEKSQLNKYDIQVTAWNLDIPVPAEFASVDAAYAHCNPFFKVPENASPTSMQQTRWERHMKLLFCQGYNPMGIFQQCALGGPDMFGHFCEYDTEKGSIGEYTVTEFKAMCQGYFEKELHVFSDGYMTGNDYLNWFTEFARRSKMNSDERLGFDEFVMAIYDMNLWLIEQHPNKEIKFVFKGSAAEKLRTYKSLTELDVISLIDQIPGLTVLMIEESVEELENCLDLSNQTLDAAITDYLIWKYVFEGPSMTVQRDEKTHKITERHDDPILPTGKKNHGADKLRAQLQGTTVIEKINDMLAFDLDDHSLDIHFSVFRQVRRLLFAEHKQWRKFFNILDKDKNGYLDKEEFSNMLATRGDANYRLDPDKVDALLRTVSDNDRVCFHEFVMFMKKGAQVDYFTDALHRKNKNKESEHEKVRSQQTMLSKFEREQSRQGLVGNLMRESIIEGVEDPDAPDCWD